MARLSSAEHTRERSGSKVKSMQLYGFERTVWSPRCCSSRTRPRALRLLCFTGTRTRGQPRRTVLAPSARSPGASRARGIFSCCPAGNTAELHPPQPYGIRRLRFCPGTSRYGAKYRFTHPAGFLKQPSGWWVTSVVKVDGCNYGSVSESEAVGPHENIFLLQLWNYDLVVPPPL